MNTQPITIGHARTVTRAAIVKNFMLSEGRHFTVVGRSGNGFTIELHNSIRRQITVGRKFLEQATKTYEC